MLRALLVLPFAAVLAACTQTAPSAPFVNAVIVNELSTFNAAVTVQVGGGAPETTIFGASRQPAQLSTGGVVGTSVCVSARRITDSSGVAYGLTLPANSPDVRITVSENQGQPVLSSNVPGTPGRCG